MNPTAAGRNASLPIDPLISIAGIRRDHTEAATITPAANPSSDFWINGFNSFFTKNTQTAPRVVPIKGMISPKNTVINTPFCLLFPSRHISKLYHTQKKRQGTELPALVFSSS